MDEPMTLDDSNSMYPTGRTPQLALAMLAQMFESIVDEIHKHKVNEARWKHWADTRP